MKELARCPRPEAKYVKTGRHRGAIVDERTKQRLEVTSDEPFIAFTLDHVDVEWGPGVRPDGVIVANVDGLTWVCFVELKGILRTEKAAKQLNAGALHFAPHARAGNKSAHGDEHHDAWTAGEDAFPPMPSRDHRVLGVFVTFRSCARTLPPPPVTIASKPYVTVTIQLAKKHPNWAEITPRDLLRRAGMID